MLPTDMGSPRVESRLLGQQRRDLRLGFRRTFKHLLKLPPSLGGHRKHLTVGQVCDREATARLTTHLLGHIWLKHDTWCTMMSWAGVIPRVHRIGLGVHKDPMYVAPRHTTSHVLIQGGGPQSQPADSQLPRYIRKTTRVLSELSLIAITTGRKPVIGTELGVGQNKGLRAMGATMRYLSH